MSVKITDNMPQIMAEKKRNGSIFLREVADRIHRESTPNTPMRTGRLRMDIVKSILGLKGTIVWGKNYAAKMEEKVFRNYTTPGTGKDFAKNAVLKVSKETQTIGKITNLIT